MDYLHDFRQDIVLKKHDKEYWNNWKRWNILYKTLAYELSSSRDVESYGYVKNQVLEYFSDCTKYISGTITLDIMSGWWFCFKYLFDLDKRINRNSKQAKKYLFTLQEQIKDINKEVDLIDFVCKNYSIAKMEIKSLLDFLDVVYTIGNITPVNNNPNADCFDSWEYKLFVSDSINYTGDSFKYFIYDSYYKEKKQWWKDFQNSNDKKKVILEYMDSRVNLIKQRGKSLVNRKCM